VGGRLGRSLGNVACGLRLITDGPFKPRLASAVMAAILFVQLAFVISTPKTVSWDASYGLLAAQQHLAGVSPSIFTLVEAEPAQITQASTQPVSYWAPAYQAVPYALRLGVFDWGVALNLTLGLILIAGTIGWFAYFAQVLGSAGFALWLSAVVALTKFRWTMALAYSGGDQLIWGATPWVLIIAAAALRLAQQGSMARATALSAGAGATGASLFALKYSGIFVAIGAAVVFGVVCLRHRYWQMILLAGVGFLTVIGAMMWVVPHGPTPAASTHGRNLMNILRATASFGLPAIGVTDIDDLLRAILANTSLNGELTAPFIGVGLSLVMLVSLIVYVRFSSAPLIRGDRVLVNLAIGAVIADFLILSLLILNGGNISLAGRFGRVSGLMLLPLLVAVWQAMLHEHRSIWRACAALGTLILLVLPTTLATARQIPNLVGRLHRAVSETDVHGIVNGYLTPGTDVQAFYAEVESIAPKSVLYTIYPQMAFPLPQLPLILVNAEELETPATLSTRRYQGRPAGGVALLLPVWFEHNGKLEAIRASFADIRQFIRHELPADPKWALWVALD
jgi:hypothetical protein